MPIAFPTWHFWVRAVKAHYLPECYLKGFLDPASENHGPREPYLWVRDSKTRVWKKRAPNNVAKVPDYYAIRQSGGTKDETREQALAGDIESQVAPVLRRIQREAKLTSGDAGALVAFAATMHIRTPSVHRLIEQRVILPRVRELLGSSWEKLRADPEALRSSLEACARDTGDHRILGLQAEAFDLTKYELHVNREFTIDTVFGVGKRLAAVLALMRWQLLRPQEGFLITSDRPVSVIAPDAPAFLRHSLLHSSAMFTLPLSKEVLMLGTWNGPPLLSWAGISLRGVHDMNIRCAGPALHLYSSAPGFVGEEELCSLERGDTSGDLAGDQRHADRGWRPRR